MTFKTRNSLRELKRRTHAVGLFLFFLLLLSPRVITAQEIFSDGFESGGIEAWSSSAGADCELVMSQVSDCDVDLGLGDWIGSPMANVYAVDDDSDGEVGGGAIEMVVDGETSMTKCFPKTFAGSAFIIGLADVKVVSGAVTSCSAESFKYTSESCSSQVSYINSALSPTSADWKPRWLGSGVASEDVSSLRLTLTCEGDAVLRFDDFVKTPMMVERP